MKRTFLAAAFVALAPSAAHAASCTVSAIAIAFGTYIPSASSPTDNTGSVTVTCTALLQAVQYTIALNAGQNSGGNFAGRRMRNTAGTSFLSYQVFTNAARTTVWGSGTGGTSTVSDSYSCVTCINQSRSYPDYGRLLGGQFSARPGLHSDTITVTVTFN